jgi:uncharacterized protein
LRIVSATTLETLSQKLDRFDSILRALPGAIVAFSGGADSALLAEMTHRALGERAVAVTADSPSLPRRELAAAQELARIRGWRHLTVQTAELDDPRYASNPTDRCYFCKSALMDQLMPLAQASNFIILLGTNTDDLADYRPGRRAADDAGARHPMAEARLSKSDVREASRTLGLPTAEKPAAACLSSRFAYGVEITPAALERVEAAEDFLLDLGFKVVRVRDLGAGRARIEVGTEEVARAWGLRQKIEAELARLGFAHTKIDERGYRSGSMNDLIPIGATGGLR